MKGKKYLKQKKGITLIALVITIVVLLILAGVTLSIVFNGGIIDKSQTAVEAYDEASAREKLQIELVALMAEKVTNKDYNLDDKIRNDGFTISDDIVIVDGYKFIIDRDKLQIVSSLGKGVENNNIGITLSQNVSADYTKSIVSITVTSDKALEYIEVNGIRITDYTENNGTYTLNDIEVTENKTVSVLVQDIDKGYKINNIKVSELTEDMEIKTAQDFKLFRDNVNSGRTYEGKIVTLAQDIDLNQGNYTIGTDGTITFASTAIQWEPIGKSTDIPFKGTFDGMYYTISGLYINNSKNTQALFGHNFGTIQNLILKNGYVNANRWIGGICAYNNGGIIKRCYNEINVCGNYIGGICGVNYGNIEECVNRGKIINRNYTYNYGGIAGCVYGVIKNCYNTGNIKGYEQVGGITGATVYNNSRVLNSYNIGIVTGNTYVGSVCGANGGSSTYPGGSIENCFYKKGTTAVGKTYGAIKNETFAFEDNATGIADMLSKLGDAFVADEKDKDGNWIYNNGYPILKWQKEHNVVNK